MELTLMHSRLGWFSSLHSLPRYLKKNKMKQQYEQYYVISTLKNVMFIQINFLVTKPPENTKYSATMYFHPRHETNKQNKTSISWLNDIFCGHSRVSNSLIDYLKVSSLPKEQGTERSQKKQPK